MATVPAPRTWAVADQLTAARLNLELRDALNFLLTGQVVSVTNSTSISLPTSGTPVLLNWDTELYDTDGIHSTVTNTSRFVAATPGLYGIWFNIAFASIATGVRQVSTRLDSGGSSAGGSPVQGGTVQIGAASGGSTFVVGYGEQRLNGTGDYLELFGVQTSGGALNINSGATVIVRRVGA